MTALNRHQNATQTIEACVRQYGFSRAEIFGANDANLITIRLFCDEQSYLEDDLDRVKTKLTEALDVQVEIMGVVMKPKPAK